MVSAGSAFGTDNEPNAQLQRENNTNNNNNSYARLHCLAFVCTHVVVPRALEMLSVTPAAPDRCSPWLRRLRLGVMY